MKLLKFILSVMLMTGWATQNVAEASEISENNFDLEGIHQLRFRKDFKEYSVKEFRERIDALKEVENYEIHMALSNDRTNHKVAEVYLYGSQGSRDLQGEVIYYHPDRTPSDYRLKFVAYDDFRLVYTQPIDYLLSMNFFDQYQLDEEFQQIMEQSRDVYVETPIALTKGKNKNNPGTDLLSLIYLPDFDRLEEAEGRFLQKRDDRLTGYMELVDIPDLLFRKSGRFEWVYQLQPEIRWQENKNQWLTSFNHRIDLNTSRNLGIQFKSMTNAQIDHRLQKDDRDFRESSDLQTALVGSKITRVNYSFDPRNNHYEASVTGVSENANLNLDLFGSEPANFRSYDLRIDYRFKPTDRNLPEMEDLKTLSQEAFNYLLEKNFNKYHGQLTEQDPEQLSND